MKKSTRHSVLLLAGAALIPAGIIFADCHRVTFTWTNEPHSVCAAYTNCPSAPVCSGGFPTGLDNLGATGTYTIPCDDYVNGKMHNGQCTGGTYIGSSKGITFTAAPTCSNKACP